MTGRVWLPLLGVLLLLPLAARRAAANDDWRPINPADLAMKDNPASPGADAMILYREETLDEARHFESEYYRIKIFTTAGKKWGDVVVPYMRGQQGVTAIEARTILPDGTVVNFTGQAYDKVAIQGGGVKVYEKTFSLPDVQPGCIVEYKYREPFDPGLYFSAMTWEVQKDLFTREAMFTFVPIADAYQEQAAGFSGWRTLFLPPNDRPKAQPNRSVILEVRDLPALTTEPYMVPKEMVRGRVTFFYRQQGKISAAQYWKQMGKEWNKELDSFVNKKKALQEALATVVHPGDAPQAQLAAIYARAQAVRNLSFGPGMTDAQRRAEHIVDNRNVEDVLKHDYGTWQDVNRLFVGLARAAGFEASLVYIPRRDENLFFPGDQDPSELPDQIVGVKLNGQDIYLDPSSPAYGFGLLPWYEDGVLGLWLSKQGGDMVQVPVTPSTEARIVRRLNVKLAANGARTGTLEVDYYGREGAVWRAQDRNDDALGRRHDLRDAIRRWLAPEVDFEITKLENWDDTAKPLTVLGTVSFPAFGDRDYGRLFLPLSLYGSYLTHAFTAPQRSNGIYFHFPFQEDDDTVIQLPPGFHVATLPKPAAVPGGAIQYRIAATDAGGSVHVTRHLEVDGIEIPVKFYGAVRAIFNTVQAGDADQMVFARQ